VAGTAGRGELALLAPTLLLLLAGTAQAQWALLEDKRGVGSEDSGSFEPDPAFSDWQITDGPRSQDSRVGRLEMSGSGTSTGTLAASVFEVAIRVPFPNGIDVRLAGTIDFDEAVGAEFAVALIQTPERVVLAGGPIIPPAPHATVPFSNELTLPPGTYDVRVLAGTIGPTGIVSFDFDFVATPEPSRGALGLVGLVVLVGLSRLGRATAR
jgi:hypothetical protein